MYWKINSIFTSEIKLNITIYSLCSDNDWFIILIVQLFYIILYKNDIKKLENFCTFNSKGIPERIVYQNVFFLPQMYARDARIIIIQNMYNYIIHVIKYKW